MQSPKPVDGYTIVQRCMPAGRDPEPGSHPVDSRQLVQLRQTLSSMSVNHRRHALTNLVRVLYGRRAVVELIDLARFAPPPPRPRWIDRRPTRNRDAFVHARAFGPWSRGSANKALRAAARRAGRSPFTVYQIRHSFAAGLRRAGTDVADIQDLYGHTRPETTMICAPPGSWRRTGRPWSDCGRAMPAARPHRLAREFGW